MATANSTEHQPVARIVQNPLVGNSDALTAESVASVLGYLAAVQPSDGNPLSDADEHGRHLILETCIGALNTISGNE